MRYVDIHARLGAACAMAVIAGALSGCAAVTDPLKAFGNAVAQTVSPSASASAPAGAAKPATATVFAAPVEPEAPVNPAAQRAFDDAARALKAGRVEEAERGFRAVAQANPKLGGPHANLGVIYRQSGKLPEAVTEFETAVRLSPSQPIYLNQLGVTYRQSGKFDKAQEAYEKAIAISPEYAAPYLNLGILNDLYLGNGPRALELYDRYLALVPTGDAVVTKWIAELKNRKPAPITVSRREEKT